MANYKLQRRLKIQKLVNIGVSFNVYIKELDSRKGVVIRYW